jgi:hypothetical protein
MPALNFHERFVPMIVSGEKRQTIRRAGKRRPPEVGEMLHLFGGIGSRLLLKAECIYVTRITIGTRDKSISMASASCTAYEDLLPAEMEEFARADGFQSADELFIWIDSNYGQTFTGYVINW